MLHACRNRVKPQLCRPCRPKGQLYLLTSLKQEATVMYTSTSFIPHRKGVKYESGVNLKCRKPEYYLRVVRRMQVIVECFY